MGEKVISSEWPLVKASIIARASFPISAAVRDFHKLPLGLIEQWISLGSPRFNARGSLQWVTQLTEPKPSNFPSQTGHSSLHVKYGLNRCGPNTSNVKWFLNWPPLPLLESDIREIPQTISRAPINHVPLPTMPPTKNCKMTSPY